MLLCSICECSIERGVENDLVMPTCDDCAEFDMMENNPPKIDLNETDYHFDIAQDNWLP